MRHGYYVNKIHGQDLFRCCFCELDGFQEDRIKDHVREKHVHLIMPEFQPDVGNRINGKSVMLCILTWNTRQISEIAVAGLVREARLLESQGVKARICWVDNGSTDGTRSVVRPHLDLSGFPYNRMLYTDNMGQSTARNRMIRTAAAKEVDYIFFQDGDLVTVPYSVSAMMTYLVKHNDVRVGCIGAYSPNCTDNELDHDIPAKSPIINDLNTFNKPHIAWTQYGLFPMGPFYMGMAFDEAECFQGPGWGFEDDELALQFKSNGYSCVNVHIRHLHKRNSGLHNLDHTLAAKVFEARRRHVVQKWGTLAAHLESVQLPNVV